MGRHLKQFLLKHRGSIFIQKEEAGLILYFYFIFSVLYFMIIPLLLLVVNLLGAHAFC